MTTPNDTNSSRAKLWALPVLRHFAPPVEVPADEAGGTDAAGSRGAAEILPWALPGTPLRTQAAAARRGFYAPALAGAPTTTRQAEILNTALIGPPTGTRGVVNGRDVLSRTTISHDPVTAYNSEPREVSSPNVIVMGDVGAGKSSHTKCNYVVRPLLLQGRRGVVFDKKDQSGEGEYSNVVRHYGFEPIRFTTDGTGTTLNLLDPTIARGTGVDGQIRLLNIVTRIARGDKPLNGWEEEALRAALRRTVGQAQGRAPVLADVLPNLGLVVDDEDYRTLSVTARDDLHKAGLSVKWTLNGLLDEYAGLLDGETSSTVDLSGKLTSFDISQLPDDGPAVPVVMAIGNMWMLGRLRSERTSATTVVYEEGWHMIGGPSAQLIKANQKLSRGLGISNVFVMHKGTDIPKDSPGMAIIQEAQTVVVYRQSRPEDALWCQQTFGFAPETARTIENLADGHYIFKYGSHPEAHVEHIRSEWERQLTNTDEGLSVGTIF
ncbi:ATP/GTP-binding protein [Cryobacterium sp. PH31-L1]|uniref:ATP/GTP-binding protein n=1 Tax=Cryobacterium sp. PH31-L1 TaxID=3046199 RepID=UPI0024BAE502|nr:ATP/GTP-binding protein [Cryobacterium sp. PH31-L1]MDJ0379153.1 ATP/GTP-binding protein [Cryobacterium sp. PH31-L1]